MTIRITKLPVIRATSNLPELFRRVLDAADMPAMSLNEAMVDVTIDRISGLPKYTEGTRRALLAWFAALEDEIERRAEVEKRRTLA